jgi:peptide/nickel transport system substrate-binding protein
MKTNILGLIAAIALAGSAAAQEPTRGGTLTVLASQSPRHLVTALSPQAATALPGGKVHETLLVATFTDAYTPALATAWQQAPDGKEFKFTLRQGVKWHDGKDFTAADVVFSMREVWLKYNPFARGVFGDITDIQTPDAHTIVFKMSRPVPASVFYNLLATYGSVVPKHIYEGSDPERNPVAIKPIGTGPFVFKEWQTGQFIIFDRNPNYWDRAKPYLDRIVIRYMNDAGSRAAALEAGEAQIGAFNIVGPDDMKRLSAKPDFVLDSRGNAGFAGTGIVEINLRNRYLAVKEVRQAIAHAIDRDFITANIYGGLGKPAISPVPSSSPMHNPNVPKYPFDKARANQLLDQAGFPRAANGQRFTLRLDPSTFLPIYGQIADYMKQALGDVGISVDIRKLEEVARLQRVYTDYDFDLTAYNLPLILDPQISTVNYYHSKAIQKGRTNTNATNYISAAFDAAADAAAIELDEAKRKAFLFEIQKVAMEDLPILPLVEAQSSNLIRTSVQNHSTNPTWPFGTWADVWLKK